MSSRYDSDMDDVDLAMRQLVYAHFGRTGQALTRAEIVAELGRSVDWVDEVFARLADAHVLVLAADGEIAKALPFCAVPTPFRVRAGGVDYYGNCAWDVFGLAALLGPSAEIGLTCGDCGEPLEGDRQGWFLHVAVPAAQWWEDIFHT